MAEFPPHGDAVVAVNVSDQIQGDHSNLKPKKKKAVAASPRDLLERHLLHQCSWDTHKIESLGVCGWRYRILGSVLLLPPLPLDLDPADLKCIIDAYLSALPKVDCIVAQEGRINGELRTPKVILLTPHRPTLTIHIENGIKFKLDVTQVMFAAGNGTERMRFAKFDVKGQIIADMFAGIGYFTLPVAKYGKPERLIALEKNPNSAHFLRENIILNKVENIVTVYEGDNRETAGEWLGKCDRVFMGYLPSAEPFIPRALQLANPRRCVIHYHYFASKEDSASVPLIHLLPHLEAIHRKDSTQITILHIENVKNYAPHLWHYVADMLLEDASQ